MFCPQSHFRYTTTCCVCGVYVYVYMFVDVFVYVYMFVYVFVYVCVFVYVRFSKNLIYDIGTEIIIVSCFATNMFKSFCKSMMLSGIYSIFRVLYFCSITT